MFSKIYISKNISVYLLYLLSVIILFTPLRILSLAFLIILGARLMPPAWHFSSKIIISINIYIAINCIFGAIFYIGGLGVSMTSFTLIQLLFLVVIEYYREAHPVLNLSLRHKISVNRLAIASLIGIFAFSAGAVLSGGSAEVLKTLSAGGDNISHIELMKAVENQNGYFYKPSILSRESITENLSGYPQGLHLNLHLIGEALEPVNPIDNQVKSSVVLYYLLSAATYLLLILTIYTYLSEMLKKFARIKYSHLLSGLFSAVASTGLLYPLYALGFISQILSMSMLLALALLLDTGFRQKDHRRLIFILALCLLAGLSMTWLFIVPIAFIASLAWLIISGEFKSKINLLIIACSCSLLLFQPVIQYLYSNKSGQGINEAGFTPVLSPLLIIALVLACVLVNILSKSAKKTYFLPITLSTAVVFSLTIYLYQIVSIGEARYYFYKSLYILVLVALLYIFIITARLINKIPPPKLSSSKKILTTGLICSITALICWHNLYAPDSYYMKQRNSSISKSSISEIISYSSKHTLDSGNLMLIGNCNRENDYVMTRFASSVNSTTNPVREDFLAELLQKDKVSIKNSIIKYQKQTNRELVVLSENKELGDYLHGYINPTQVNVINLSTAQPIIQKDKCPESVQ